MKCLVLPVDDVTVINGLYQIYLSYLGTLNLSECHRVKYLIVLIDDVTVINGHSQKMYFGNVLFKTL